MKISICIPAYEMYGYGVSYLTELLKTIKTQTYKDFEIVISDHSVNDDIQNYISTIEDMNIVYHRNERGRGNSSINMNEAIKLATGKIIKIIHQDDYFIDDNSLNLIASCFENSNVKWGAVGFIHNNSGSLQRPMYRFTGCPSTSFFLNDDNYFDENLIFINDHEMHTRLRKKYGEPFYIINTLVVIRQHDNTVSQKLINSELENREWDYFKEKHK